MAGAIAAESSKVASIMPVVADVELPAEEFALGEVLQEIGEYRAELTQFVPLRDQFVPYFWIKHDDPSHVAPTLEEHSQVKEVAKYDERAGWTLFELNWMGPIDDFLSILMEQEVLVTQASGTPDTWEFELLGSHRDDLAAFQTACTENDIPIRIQTVSQAGPTSIDKIGLTDDQREILQLAYDRGYFGVPREVTVTDLSEELDISPQAASKRLRRALETAVDYLLTE